MKTVKQITNSTWEVKLGAGILPVTITVDDVMRSRQTMVGTSSVPFGFNLEEYNRKMDAVYEVEKWLLENNKEIGFGVFNK
jgi:hypothetical protein